MEQGKKIIITVSTTVKSNTERVWQYWTEPEHIVKWNYASEDWHTPSAVNDLRKGGKFLSRMEAKDGSTGFDLEGVYDEVVEHELIEFTMGDERKVKIVFINKGDNTEIVESFETEDINSAEMQRNGWQAILDNFKKYAESVIS
ncbi:MAG: SRPBCC family protein [Bacteroidetes bacterium]|nr:SRPBCC family protein [Bacteroidota bacterium]